MLNIQQNEPLSKHTSFRLGGPARFFVVAETTEAIKEALEWARQNNQKYFILGGGSNVLFPDAGFDGLVIRVAYADIEMSGEEVAAGAGAPLFSLIKKTTENGLAGLENLSGIPGTVGGADCNNAGAYGSSFADFFTGAEIVFPDGRIETANKDWMQYDYRASKMKYWTNGGKPAMLKVFLRLSRGDKEALNERIKEILLQRTKSPKGFSAGCAFKNIKGQQVGEILERLSFSPDKKNLFLSRQAIPAAWFIEQAELKGKKIGGAYVAEGHANYIMNDGAAKSDDVIMLISYIKQQVQDKFGVQLEDEVELVH